MNALLIAAVILLAVLVGAAVPVLIQMRGTLKSAQTVLDRVGPRVEQTLDDIDAAVVRLDRVIERLEKGSEKANELFDAAASLGSQVRRLRRSMRTAVAVGSAVGPALAAALRALVSPADGDDTGDSFPGAAAAGHNDSGAKDAGPHPSRKETSS